MFKIKAKLFQYLEKVYTDVVESENPHILGSCRIFHFEDAYIKLMK